MKKHSEFLRRAWILPLAAIALIAIHAFALHYVLSHAAFSTAILSGAIILITIQHMGLLGSAYARLRRYVRRNRQ